MRAVTLLLVSLLAEPTAMSWSDTVTPLVELRGKAEHCAAVLKRLGDQAQINAGEITYGDAKSETEAVIAGLLTALAARETPASLTSLQERLAKGVSSVAAFCNSVTDIVTAKTQGGARDVWTALTKLAGLETLVKKLSDGVSAIYNDYRSDQELIRKSIQGQLEAAKWPDFSKIAVAPASRQ